MKIINLMYRKNQDVLNEGENWTELFKQAADAKRAGRPAANGVVKSSKNLGKEEDKLSKCHTYT